MKRTCQELMQYIDECGTSDNISISSEHKLCDCINRLGDSIKLEALGFSPRLQRKWSGFRIFTAHLYHRLDFEKMWPDLNERLPDLMAEIEAKLGNMKD